jgi:hypothetical protein
MGRIQQGVRDVLHIADKTEDFGQAKERIERLFAVSETLHRGHLAIAQRVRDQINEAYEDVPTDTRRRLDRVLAWLDCNSARTQVDVTSDALTAMTPPRAVSVGLMCARAPRPFPDFDTYRTRKMSDLSPESAPKRT